MNCAECQELLVARDEGVLEPHRRGELAEHLAACPQCRDTAEAHERLRCSLERRGQVYRQAGADQAVMDRIMQRQADQLRRLAMQRRIRYVSTAVAVAAVVIVMFTLSGLFRQKEATAAEVLTQAASAASKLQAVHLKGRMRTVAHDNFQMIGLDYDFVPVEMWKQFTPTPKWRVDKSGRVAVMDGNETVMLIKSGPPKNLVGFPAELLNVGQLIKPEPPLAAKGGPQSGMVGFLAELLNVDQVLDHELGMAIKQGHNLQLIHQQGTDGEAKLVVTIEAKAKVDPNDWLRNAYIEDSDTRRIYTFDAKSKLLAGLQIFVKTEGAEVLVLEISQVECNPQLDPALFALEIPQGTIWYQEPQMLPDNEKYAKMTPEEAARAFFEACEKEDWEEVKKFLCMTAIREDHKRYLGGLKLISLGKAFTSSGYGGYFVPYEIKLKGGRTKKSSLAVRNDNPARRYVVDGGI